MIHPVGELLHHKLRQEAKAGIDNSCLGDLTNLVSFCRTSYSGGRDSLRKSRAGRTQPEHSQAGLYHS